MSDPKSLTLQIDGMHCTACVNRVTTALRRVEGVAVEQVTVGSADVHYDPEQTSPEEIARAVDNIGFTVLSPR